MKKIMFIASALIILVSLGVRANNNVSTVAKVEFSEQTNTLKGIVADKATKETLAGATIYVNGQKMYTDLDGNFSISNLCGGNCQLKISMISYKDHIVDIDINKDKSLQIKLEQQ